MDRDSRQELSENGPQYNVYVNQGKFCDVPRGLKFSKCTLIEGWSFWCSGKPSYVYTNSRGGKVRAPIHPFALFLDQKVAKGVKEQMEG